jgi:hypothetical protein
MIEIHFKREAIGQIGRDDSGTRFVVLFPGAVQGTDPSDEPNFVATLPPRTSSTTAKPSGIVLHKSFLDLPIEWEENPS